MNGSVIHIYENIYKKYIYLNLYIKYQRKKIIITIVMVIEETYICVHIHLCMSTHTQAYMHT